MSVAAGIPDAVKREIDTDRFPEWPPFIDAVQQRRPDAGTWCEAWTVRDIVIHQAGNALELGRVLGGHLAGEPVATRTFEEREAPLRTMNETDLWAALHTNMAMLNEVAEAADDIPAETDVAWTGRTMKVPWFAEHMREELVLHGWDITGDDAAAQARLAEHWMTTHSVLAVGKPLLAKGVKQLRPGRDIDVQVIVFPFRVTFQADGWKEQGQRSLEWIRCQRAALLVAEPALRRLIIDFGLARTPTLLARGLRTYRNWRLARA